MIGKLIKIVAIGTIGLATGLVGLGLLAALDDASNFNSSELALKKQIKRTKRIKNL